MFAQLLRGNGLGQGPQPPVAAALGGSLDGVDVQRDLLVGMGRGGGFRGAASEVGRDDGLDADLIDLLQPAPLPEVGVRLVAAAEGAGAPGPERAFRVVPDHTSTGLRERPHHTVDAFLGDEDHKLSQRSPRRNYPQRTRRPSASARATDTPAGAAS